MAPNSAVAFAKSDSELSKQLLDAARLLGSDLMLSSYTVTPNTSFDELKVVCPNRCRAYVEVLRLQRMNGDLAEERKALLVEQIRSEALEAAVKHSFSFGFLKALQDPRSRIVNNGSQLLGLYPLPNTHDHEWYGHCVTQAGLLYRVLSGPFGDSLQIKNFHYKFPDINYQFPHVQIAVAGLGEEPLVIDKSAFFSRLRRCDAEELPAAAIALAGINSRPPPYLALSSQNFMNEFSDGENVFVSSVAANLSGEATFNFTIETMEQLADGRISRLYSQRIELEGLPRLIPDELDLHHMVIESKQGTEETKLLEGHPVAKNHRIILETLTAALWRQIDSPSDCDLEALVPKSWGYY